MAATLEEVAHRVTTIAEAAAGTDDDHLRRGRSGPTSISQELFEVERTLGQAVRRLEALTDALRHQGPGRD